MSRTTDAAAGSLGAVPESEVFVRLLGGPVEVLQGTERVALARRPAAVLAALALRLNVAVSYGVIAELLWSPEELPASPRRAIQTYASRVREVLGRDAVVAHGDGLRLQLDPDRVDLYRFRRLVDDRHRVRARGAGRVE